ncbi:hypothetical protein FJZ19_02070 [Candidatus Pacearchaeota archaeon]|nr:hypothetical protein [Candidatus Pacearchaeota archaeon]
MKILVLENAGKILRERKKIEKNLDVKITGKGKKIEIKGSEIDEYVACCILEAIEAGFSIENSIALKEQDYLLEKIQIKNLTKRKNLSQVRARIIGKNGKTLDLIEELSDCFIVLHANIVYIIGRAEDIKKAINAITKIIHGSKQSSVYSYLEKQKKIYHPEDLGLKIK